MSVDLDISNYELNDILKLFKIKINFDETDLKKAKQIVLKTHPDKSNLAPEYFIFYSKAYKMIYSIWEFKKKGDVDITKNTEFSNYSEKEKGAILDNFFESNTEIKSGKNFNEWFNKEFIKNKIENENKGYGDWLQDVNDNDEVLINNVPDIYKLPLMVSLPINVFDPVVAKLADFEIKTGSTSK